MVREITSDNISDIFEVIDMSNIFDIDRPIKLYDKSTKIAIDTGLDYREIYVRKAFLNNGDCRETFMKVRSYYDRIEILVSAYKNFETFEIFETKLTLDSLNEKYERLNSPYIINTKDGLCIDVTNMPAIDQRDFYTSIYNTKPVIKGCRKYVDKDEELSLISIIISHLPDEFATYKNANYTSIVWLVAEDESAESIMITDENKNKTILVKLK